MRNGAGGCAKLASPTSSKSIYSYKSSPVGMPRTILTRPPGGASGKVRKRYAVRQKLQMLEECSRLQRSAKHSVRSAAAAMGVSHALLVRWYQRPPLDRGFPWQEQGHMRRAHGAARLHQGGAPAVDFCSTRAGDCRDNVPRCLKGNVNPLPPAPGRWRLEVLQGQRL